MIIVYVKHYLNEAGRDYFAKTWYPYVEGLIKTQPGFISISTNREERDEECINITVKFADQKTLDKWVANDAHQKVINDLDEYRTQGQRWYITGDEAEIPPPLTAWEEAPLPESAPGRDSLDWGGCM